MWEDTWIPDIDPLINKILTHSNFTSQCSLKDMMLPDGSWNLDLFRIWLIHNIINSIANIPPPHLAVGVDKIIWACSSFGTFFVRSAFWSIKESSWEPKDDRWNHIWKFQGPQCVRLCLWLATKQRLHTNIERLHRGLATHSTCHICGHDTKDTIHALRDCLAAKEVWLNVLPLEQQNKFFSKSL